MPLAPAVIAAIIAAGASAAQGITRGGPRRQYKWNEKAAEQANRRNRENQQWLLDQERQLQKEAREYDSPKAQMDRYLAAGLNPHMIYGSGSSAGQAFPINAGNMPSYQLQAPNASYPDVVGSFLGAQQSLAQTDLLRQKAEESGFSAALKDAQADLIRMNPMLNPEVAQAISDSMLQTAKLKAVQASYTRTSWIDMSETESARIYVAEIRTKIESLLAKNRLLDADEKIRAEILNSKEFQNDLLEVQRDWLKNGDVSPEHIRQGLMLLLMKLTPGFK